MQFTLPSQKDFIATLKKIKPYQSKEETRYYLNGVYFHLIANHLALTATDGHRLLRIKCHVAPEDAPDGATLNAIVPSDVINTLCTAKGISADKPVIIRFTNTEAEFNFIDYKVTTKLIDGTFPEYENVIPKVEDIKGNHAFRSSYLVDTLKTFGNEGVRIGWNQESKTPEMEPVVIQGAMDDVLAVLMPMRI